MEERGERGMAEGRRWRAPEQLLGTLEAQRLW